MKSKHNIAVLILAAGSASRMGQPKQLLPWKNTTLLGHTIALALKVSKNIGVVVGANAQEVIEKIPNGIYIINNPIWQSGMGTSISTGVGALAKKYKPERLLILLVDQPLIDTVFLNKLLSYHSKLIVATQYPRSIGVPAVFPKSYFLQLQNLQADFGARHILKALQEEVVSVPAAQVTADIDTPETYHELFSKYGV